MISRHTSIRRLVPTLALGLLALAPLTRAGTYSAVGIQWYPSNSPGTSTSGYITFGGGTTSDPNTLDVCYGLSGGCGAPTNTSLNATDTESTKGMWVWVVQWTGAVGETPPGMVSANIEWKGAASASAGGDIFAPGYSASGSANLQDGNGLYPIQGALSAAANAPYSDPESYSGSYNQATGTSSFVLVSGTTYQATVLQSVNAVGTANASGQRASGGSPGGPGGPGSHGLVEASASAGFSENMIARLTMVGGQRVQSDISQNPGSGTGGGGGGGGGAGWVAALVRLGAFQGA